MSLSLQIYKDYKQNLLCYIQSSIVTSVLVATEGKLKERIPCPLYCSFKLYDIFFKGDDIHSRLPEVLLSFVLLHLLLLNCAPPLAGFVASTAFGCEESLNPKSHLRKKKGSDKLSLF